MNADEAWESFVKSHQVKKNSAEEKLDVLCSQMNEVQTDIKRLTDTIPENQGDDAALETANSMAEFQEEPVGADMMGAAGADQAEVPAGESPEVAGGPAVGAAEETPDAGGAETEEEGASDEDIADLLDNLGGGAGAEASTSAGAEPSAEAGAGNDLISMIKDMIGNENDPDKLKQLTQLLDAALSSGQPQPGQGMEADLGAEDTADIGKSALAKADTPMDAGGADGAVDTPAETKTATESATDKTLEDAPEPVAESDDMAEEIAEKVADAVEDIVEEVVSGDGECADGKCDDAEEIEDEVAEEETDADEVDEKLDRNEPLSEEGSESFATCKSFREMLSEGISKHAGVDGQFMKTTSHSYDEYVQNTWDKTPSLKGADNAKGRISQKDKADLRTASPNWKNNVYASCEEEPVADEGLEKSEIDKATAETYDEHVQNTWDNTPSLKGRNNAKEGLTQKDKADLRNASPNWKNNVYASSENAPVADAGMEKSEVEKSLPDRPLVYNASRDPSGGSSMKPVLTSDEAANLTDTERYGLTGGMSDQSLSPHGTYMYKSEGKHIMSFKEMMGFAKSDRPDVGSTVNGNIMRPEASVAKSSNSVSFRELMSSKDPHEFVKKDWEEYNLYKSQRGL